MMNCAALLLTASLALGQLQAGAQPAATYEHLKFLEQFAGSWSYEGTWENLGAYAGQETSEWNLNKSLFKTTGWYRVGDGPRIDYQQITHWDPAEKQVVTHGYDSRGNSMRRVGTYDPQAKLWKSQLSGSQDGQELRYTVTMQVLTPAKYQLKLTRSDESAQPDRQVDAVYTRTVAVPREVLKELEYLVGEWDYEGYELNSKEPVKGACTYRWAPGGHCLVWEQTWIDQRGLSHGSGIIGWDPSTNGLAEQDLYQGGDFGRHSYTLLGDRWEADSQYITASGEVTRGKMTMTKRGPAEMEYRIADYVGPLGKSGEAWLLTFRKAAALTSADFQAYGELIVGEWQGEFVLSGDVPGVGKNGDKLKGRATIVWANDNKGLEVRWKFGPVTGTTITYWDAEARQIRETAFDSAGAVYQGHVAREDGQWVASSVAAYPNGTRRAVIDRLTVADGGKTHVHEGVVHLNGERQPDYRDVWRRVEK